jgi:adenosylcobinamide-phosphate synthase
VVAPLFWAALLGLPGAVLYRFANTADAMWGYRGRFEWAGKWAARADDVLSWLPARLTGLALAVPAQWPLLRREARQTPSPNGGWPMGAMALRLGVCLRKPGVYTLNAQAAEPTAGHVQRALRAATAVAWGAAALAALAALPGWGRAP